MIFITILLTLLGGIAKVFGSYSLNELIGCEDQIPDPMNHTSTPWTDFLRNSGQTEKDYEVWTNEMEVFKNEFDD